MRDLAFSQMPGRPEANRLPERRDGRAGRQTGAGRFGKPQDDRAQDESSADAHARENRPRAERPARRNSTHGS